MPSGSVPALLIAANFFAAEGVEHWAQRLAGALDAQAVPCPVDTKSYLPSRIVTCSRVTYDAPQLKEIVDATMAADGAPTPRLDWLKAGKGVRRFYDFPDTVLSVEFFTASHVFVVSYPKTIPYCETSDVAPDPAVSAADDVADAQVVQRTMRRPAYPELARETRIEATIVVRATVQTDGTTKDLCVVPTAWKGQLGFEHAALSAVRDWHYSPATRLGEPVEARVTVRVSFRVK